MLPHPETERRRIRQAILSSIAFTACAVVLLAMAFKGDIMDWSQQQDLARQGARRSAMLELTTRLADSNNSSLLIDEAIAEQASLPATQKIVGIPEDLKKHLDLIKQIQNDDDILPTNNENFTMPANLRDIVDAMNGLDTNDHVLDHLNLTGKIKPLSADLIASVKQV